jgi:hypothetical protein
MHKSSSGVINDRPDKVCPGLLLPMVTRTMII